MSDTMNEEQAKRWDLAREHFLEDEQGHRTLLIESARDYGRDTARGLFILNGSAIVALLTLMGALFSRGDVQARIASQTLTELVPALQSFGTGLVLALAISACAYVNFGAHAALRLEPPELFEWLTQSKMPERSPWLNRMISWTWPGALVLGGLSGGAFLLGAYLVVGAFREMELITLWETRHPSRSLSAE